MEIQTLGEKTFMQMSQTWDKAQIIFRWMDPLTTHALNINKRNILAHISQAKLAITQNYIILMGLNARKLVFGVANNKGTKQPAHLQSDHHLCYSLIGKFISKLATSEISIFYLVSVAEETGLRLTLLAITRRFS